MDNIEEKYFFTRGKAILLLLILIIVFTIFIVIKIKSTNYENKYKLFESELKAAAENYAIINNIMIDEGEEIKIKMDKMIQMNLVYNDLKDKCSGYVIMASEKNIETDSYNLVYRPYIKCGLKYTTVNYSEY